MAVVGHSIKLSGTDVLAMTVFLHGATALATLIVFRKRISQLLSALFSFRSGKDMTYLLKLLASALPIAVVGLFFKDMVESFFDASLALIGVMLLITSLLLFLTKRVQIQEGTETMITWRQTWIISLAQVCAVLPGISRSGITIASGILAGGSRQKVAEFSFLMVLLPIIGQNLLDVVGWIGSDTPFFDSTSSLAVIVGGLTALVSGWIACKKMLQWVKSRLIWFAVYCAVMGIVLIVLS